MNDKHVEKTEKTHDKGCNRREERVRIYASSKQGRVNRRRLRMGSIHPFARIRSLVDRRGVRNPRKRKEQKGKKIYIYTCASMGKGDEEKNLHDR